MSDFEDTESIYDISDSESETSETSDNNTIKNITTTTNPRTTTTSTADKTTEDDDSSSSDDDIIEDNDEEEEEEEEEEDKKDESSSSESDLDNEDDDEEDDDSEEEDLDDEIYGGSKKGKNTKKAINSSLTTIQQSGGADIDDDEYDDLYLQKFNEEINKNYISDNHPECVNVNFDEIIAMSKIVRDSKNNIIDDFHKTLPYLTKYEKARILGQRAKQINSGMSTFVKVPENIIDGYLIAEMELNQKRIPFIIKRPIPGGGCEFWRVSDLELVDF
jgi:DNA-directed RNA polymerase I, II, and III subunit RPABC2